MGLAAYGDPDALKRQIAEIIQVREDGYAVDLEALGFPSFRPEGLDRLSGRGGSRMTRSHRSICTSLRHCRLPRMLL